MKSLCLKFKCCVEQVQDRAERKKCAVSLIFKMAGTTFFRLWQPVAAPEMLLALPDWRMILMSELLGGYGQPFSSTRSTDR